MYGEIVLRVICDVFGDATYVIIKEILEAAKLDKELAIYGLAFMYGLPMYDADGKLKLKRRVECVDLAKFLEADEERAYIRKPAAEEHDAALREIVKALSSTMRRLFGGAELILARLVAEELAKSFRGPNEAAARVFSEISRNPYVPKIQVEVEGRKIIVYSRYPFDVTEEFAHGTFLPFVLAYAAAMMSGYDSVRLLDREIRGKNTIVFVFEATDKSSRGTPRF